MKKLTKIQKNNLKKKVLRIANITCLIVGGLSFLVVLYAIIAGSLKATAPETSEISEEVVERPNLVQSAMYPPVNADLSLSAVYADDYAWSWNSLAGKVPALYEYNDATIDFYQNSYYWHDLSITTIVYAPTTTLIPHDEFLWALQGEYIGSAASSPAFQRFIFDLDNRNSAQAFLFYADFSSSGWNVDGHVYIYDKDNNNLGLSSPFTSYFGSSLRAYYVPPYSRLRIPVGYASLNVYLDALYIDDIGSTAYDTGFDDGFDDGGVAGYGQGYDDGIIDGYNQGYTHGEEDGYTEGYSEGHTDGYISGYDFGLSSTEGYPEGYNAGFTVGYNGGYSDGLEVGNSEGAIENAFDLIYAGAESVDKILSISIFGSITLGMLLFTPLIVGISLAVIKVIKG